MARRGIVVFGGNGFVGTRVCAQAVVQGLPVTSVSRSGTVPVHLQAQAGGWAEKVKWEKGDAFEPNTYMPLLKEAEAVVVSVGSPPVPFVDYGYQLRMNGHSVQRVAEAAREADVPRLVVVNATMPAWLKNVAKGYFDGKHLAREAVAAFTVDRPHARAAIVKPGIIYGTRYEGSIAIPLGVVFGPVSHVLRRTSGLNCALRSAAPYLLDGILHPPVPVESVASAALHHASAAPSGDPPIAVVSCEEIFAYRA